MNFTINYRFLVKLLLALALVGGSLFALNRFQVYRNAGLLVERAEAAAEEEEWPEVVKSLRSYLALRRDDADARELMMRALAEMNQFEAAYNHGEATLRLDANRPEARFKLAEVAMAMGRFPDAKEHLQNLLDVESIDQGHCRYLLGRCEWALGDNQAARNWMQQAIEEAPREIDYASVLAQVWLQEFDAPAEGAATLDSLVEARESDVESLITRGRWLFQTAGNLSNPDIRQRFLDQAAEDTEQILESTPTHAGAVKLKVDLALLEGNANHLQDLVDQTIEANPEEAELYGAGAEIALAKGETQQAAEFLRAGLKAIPGHSDLLWNLAQLELDRGEVASSQQVIEELRTRGYPEAPLSYLEARVLVQQRKWREAAALIENSRSLFDRSQDLLKQVDYLLARCYMNMGNSDEQLVALRRAVQTAPTWSPARQELANALVRTGRVREALNEYSQIVRMPEPPVSAVLNYVRLMLVNKLEQGGPAPDWGPIETMLDRLEERPEAATDVAILRAELAAASGYTDQAEQILSERLEVEPESIALHQAYISLLVRYQKWEKAEPALADLESAVSDIPTLRLERARFLIRRDGQEVSMDKLRELAAPDPGWSEEQRVELARGFANYFLALEEFEACQAQASIVADSDIGADDLRIHLLQFDLAQKSGDVDTMLESLEAVEQIEGRGPLWRVGEAIRLSTTAGQLDPEDSDEQPQREAMYANALEHLSEAAVERPGWARVARLQGQIHEAQGQPRIAAERYLQAIEFGENSPQLVSRTIFLLFEQGRYVEADKVVRKLQEQKTPFSSELTRVASQVSLQLENVDRALSLAQQWATESGNHEDHVWLAQLHSVAGDYQAAEEEFRQAIEIDPSHPAGWISLIQMLSRQGEQEKGREVLEEAKSEIRDEDLEDALAQGYEALGDFDQAERMYLAAIEESPDDPALLRRLSEFYLLRGRPGDAKPHLERLVQSDGDADTAQGDIIWGRRRLALVLASEGAEAQFREAQQLIEENRAIVGETAEDQRVLANVLSIRPDRESRQQAARLLEELSESREFSLADRFALAELYRKTGDWQRYNQAMRQLMGQGGADRSEYVRAYAEALVSRGEMTEAQLWFDRLRRMAPEQRETVRVEAQLLYRSQKFAELVALLEQATVNFPESVWPANLAEGYAMALKENAPEPAARLREIAEEGYTLTAKRDPDNAWMLAAFYARSGRLNEAIEQLESESDPQHVAEVVQAGLQSGQLTSEQKEQLKAFTLDAYRDAQTSVELGMCVGDLHSIDGDWKDAAATYEQVLKIEPDHLPALNNLAMVLALTGNRLDRAHQAIGRAIELRGRQDFLLDTRGIVRLAAGAAAEAESDFRTAHRVTPRPDRLFHLAQALLAQGRHEEARSAFQQAREQGLTAQTLHPLEAAAFERLEMQLR